jgi:hypothetical protein
MAVRRGGGDDLQGLLPLGMMLREELGGSQEHRASQDCHACDKFVLSGADLLYWRRKREQWASIAERAPDDATADYLHQVFAPTAQAIDGLEKALAGLGLLDDALALDLRRPQDYYHRLWNLSFRAADLADDGQPEGS